MVTDWRRRHAAQPPAHPARLQREAYARYQWRTTLIALTLFLFPVGFVAFQLPRTDPEVSWVPFALVGPIYLSVGLMVFMRSGLDPLRELVRRRWSTSGNLDRSDIHWIILHLLPRHTTPEFEQTLYTATVERLGLDSGLCEPSPDPRTRQAVAAWANWVRRGDDPEALLDAVNAGLSLGELIAHLNGSCLIPREAISTLAALHNPNGRSTTRPSG